MVSKIEMRSGYSFHTGITFLGEIGGLMASSGLHNPYLKYLQTSVLRKMLSEKYVIRIISLYLSTQSTPQNFIFSYIIWL